MLSLNSITFAALTTVTPSGLIAQMELDPRKLRLQNLHLLLRTRAGGVVAEFARQLQKDKNQVRFILNPEKSGGRWVGEKQARDIEARLALRSGWLDRDHSDESDEQVMAQVLSPSLDRLSHKPYIENQPSSLHSSENNTNLEEAPALRRFRKVPVVGEVKGGMDGYLDELEYPVGYGDGYVEWPTSDPNAYALRVRGDSMHPRYSSGEFVIISPLIEAEPGDYVVVICRDGRKMLKRLNWFRDDEVQFASINDGFPPMTMRKDEIAKIHLVAGSLHRSALKKG